MPDHETARRQLAAAQENYRKVSMIPEKDEFIVGTVLRWSDRVAIKATDNPAPDWPNWAMSRYASGVTWDYLVANIAAGITDSGLRIVTGYEDITVHPEPDLEVLKPDQSGYEGLILRDPKRNLAWELRGTTWYRVFEDD